MDIEDSVEFLNKRPHAKEDIDNSQVALDAFGKLLMQWVRDYAIRDSDNIARGYDHSTVGEPFAEIPRIFSSEQREVLHRFIPEIVDTTLHHLLWTLERVEWLDITIHTGRGTVSSIRSVSDGLPGEVYEWVPKYSVERYNKALYSKE